MRHSETQLHPLVEEASTTLFEEAHFRQAVLDATLALRDRIRTQSGLRHLDGDPLVGQAFGGPAPAIVLADPGSESGKNVQRGTLLLAQGVFASIRNPLAHEATDVSEEEAIEMLATISLIARRLEAAEQLDLSPLPTIVAVHPETADSVELLVTDTPGGLEVLADDARLPISSRTGHSVRVKVPAGRARVRLVLKVGDRVGPLYVYEHVPFVEEGSSHRVEAIDVPVFAGATGAATLPVSAVCLRSDEGGRPFIRYFPTRERYSAGRYVTWEWDLPGVGHPRPHGVVGGAVDREGWVERDNERILAWSASAFFAGREIGAGGEVRLAKIELYPQSIQLRPEDCAPLRVVAFFTDGIATRREDVTTSATFAAGDEACATVQAAAVRGVRAGQTVVRAHFEGHFAGASVLVAALASGHTTRYLGGLPRVVTARRTPVGLLLVDQRERILVLRDDLSLETLASVPMPDTYPTGLEGLAHDEEGNVYVRMLWNNSIAKLDRSSEFSRSIQAHLPRGDSSISAFCWLPGRGLAIADHRGQLWQWNGVDEPEPWISVPVAPIAMDLNDEGLWVLGGQVSPGLVCVAQDGTVGADVLAGLAVEGGASALLCREQDILIAGFQTGRVYSLRHGVLRVLAESFVNPTSLTADGVGGLFVVNFGAGSVSRILP